MKEEFTTVKDLKGGTHEAPIIKAPYLKNLHDKRINVAFADRSCIGILDGEDEDFVSIITKEGQEIISKHSIKRIIPMYNEE